MEDVAIAYGYNNLVKSVPKTVTVGRELPLNQARRAPTAPPHTPRQSCARPPLMPACCIAPRRPRRPGCCPPPPRQQMCELLRGEAAMAGFTEILTWALCSHAENFDALRRPDDGTTAATIGNPATAEFEVCRTSLLPGALKTLGAAAATGAWWGGQDGSGALSAGGCVGRSS